ncbi:MAG TPA: ABC transporter ATP-binding protein [Acidobacteriota bacterium]|nr:ABC transporter ATP-binding protein [Acidobacteriota bacterium]
MMTNDFAIRVHDVSKRYRIGVRDSDHDTLVGKVISKLSRPIHNLRRLRSLSQFEPGQKAEDVIWALKDVSFDVRSGEVVGLIGSNGAGKSTLLKILSQITEPTGGRVEIRGRVSSLLEVGTGFHPELTGRENVFLNGAVLGMTRREIESKFEEIVEFAGVSRFIETPVKRYSSGMKVRLAFAVAAHLEPEILLVDEVLAVGDIAFQKKCLGKMDNVAKEGRTVIFVSHNIASITRLCSRAILLENGRAVMDGPAHEVASVYLNAGEGTAAFRQWDAAQAPGGDIARLRSVKVIDEDGEIAESIDIRRKVGIQIEFEVLKEGHELLPTFHVFNQEGLYLFPALDLDPVWRRRKRPRGVYKTTGWIPGNLLSEGIHLIQVALAAIHPFIPQFNEHSAVAFTVVDSTEGDSARGDFAQALGGAVRPRLEWSTVAELESGTTVGPVGLGVARTGK